MQLKIWPLDKVQFTTEDTNNPQILQIFTMTIIIESINKSYKNVKLDGLGVETKWSN
jgi:hypothetical protein